MPGSVFVTVGTTKFDALIAAVDSVAVAEALLAKGYTELIMQVGQQVTFCMIYQAHHHHVLLFLFYTRHCAGCHSPAFPVDMFWYTGGQGLLHAQGAVPSRKHQPYTCGRLAGYMV